jgi:L-alanine-DL-glutamate epimerase-like enolase superfamily enzyme
MDSDGFVTVPTGPGLGYDIVWDYIEEHRIPDAALSVVYP